LGLQQKVKVASGDIEQITVRDLSEDDSNAVLNKAEVLQYL